MQATVHGVAKSQTRLSDFTLSLTHAYILFFWTSLVAQTVKRLPTMRDTWVQSLGQEDLLEKEMATHSSTLAWKIPWTKELGAGYCLWGRKESGRTEQLHFTLFVNSHQGALLFSLNTVGGGGGWESAYRVCLWHLCTHVCWWFGLSVVSDSRDSTDYSLPDSSVHGILQARILEWVARSEIQLPSCPFTSIQPGSQLFPC